MEKINENIVKNTRSMIINSLSLDKEDLVKLCRTLQDRANAAREIEVQYFPRGNVTDEQYQAAIDELRKSFELKILLTGEDGVQLWGNIDEVFDPVNYPDNLKTFYVDSASTLRDGYKYHPRNSFTVFLDFSKPSPFDFNLMPSHRTPNGSNFSVEGYDVTLVNGIFHDVKDFVNKRKTIFSFVHKHSMFDIMLWFIGFPVSFFLCDKLSIYIETIGGATSTFLANALYLYCFLITLMGFRFIFHYLRWVFPLVEYRFKGSKILAHRFVWSTLNLGWIGAIIYDLVF